MKIEKFKKKKFAKMNIVVLNTIEQNFSNIQSQKTSIRTQITKKIFFK